MLMCRHREQGFCRWCQEEKITKLNTKVAELEAKLLRQTEAFDYEFDLRRKHEAKIAELEKQVDKLSKPVQCTACGNRSEFTYVEGNNNE